MSHHTGNCPFFFLFLSFLWNLSFWGACERGPPRPRPFRDRPWAGDVVGTQNCVSVACQAVRSSELSGVGNEEPKMRRIPGAAREEAGAEAAAGCLAAARSPAPAAGISPLFILSFPDTSLLRCAQPERKEVMFSGCILSGKSNGSCLPPWGSQRLPRQWLKSFPGMCDEREGSAGKKAVQMSASLKAAPAALSGLSFE